MSTPPPESLVRSVARPLLAALGLVAAVVQLVSAPWSWGVRIAIFAGFAVAALLLAAYQLGVRRGESAASPRADPIYEAQPPSAQSWTPEELVDRKVVKVASKSGNVAICELADGGSLSEQWLPLSPRQAYSPQESRPGTWFLERGDGLRIVVRGFNLLLQPNLNGTWSGFEQFGDDTEPFIGAIVDPEPLSAGMQWVGLKLGEHGARRIVAADASGRLRESNPFQPEWEWVGNWSVDGGRLHIETGEKWSLLAEQWRPGIHLGMEQSSEGERGFAVVRVQSHT